MVDFVLNESLQHTVQYSALRRLCRKCRIFFVRCFRCCCPEGAYKHIGGLSFLRWVQRVGNDESAFLYLGATGDDAACCMRAHLCTCALGKHHHYVVTCVYYTVLWYVRALSF